MLSYRVKGYLHDHYAKTARRARFRISHFYLAHTLGRLWKGIGRWWRPKRATNRCDCTKVKEIADY